MKGVILCGGAGTRLSPLTNVTNKHLLPVFNKPMIYYPLQTLIDAGIKDILIVTGGESVGDFLRLLGSGRDRDVRFTYRCQDGSGGIPVALSLAREFVDDKKFVCILGDNVMEKSIKNEVDSFIKSRKGAKILLQKVNDPQRFGLAEIKNNKLVATYEKPSNPKTDLAIIGVYMFDGKVFDIIPKLKPSRRNELEITEVIDHYIKNDNIDYSFVDGFWIDAGTFGSLYKATMFIADKENKK